MNISAIKSFFAVLVLNAALFYPVAYNTYKSFNPELTPWDTEGYMAMVDDLDRAETPFRYRILTPLLVRSMEILPGYPIEVAATKDERNKKTLFHFIIVNTIFMLSTSALLYLFLVRSLSPALAYFGSILYLFSFYPLIVNVIPMTDALCHLSIIAAILSFESKKPWAFALSCLIGVFGKESVLLVAGGWVALAALRDRKAWAYLVATAPAIIGYFAYTKLAPAANSQPYFDLGFLLKRSVSIFNPQEYSFSLLFHHYGAHAPLLLAALLWLVSKSVRQSAAWPKEILLFPILLALGMAMGIGNNAGRIAFMAFPALILFELRVIQAWFGKQNDPIFLKPYPSESQVKIR